MEQVIRRAEQIRARLRPRNLSILRKRKERTFCLPITIVNKLIIKLPHNYLPKENTYSNLVIKFFYLKPKALWTFVRSYFKRWPRARLTLVSRTKPRNFKTQIVKISVWLCPQVLFVRILRKWRDSSCKL